MRLGVIGAGGVGGYFGARLVAAGADVHLLARGAHLAAIRNHGLHINSIHGDLNVRPAATDDAATIGPCDVVLVCVKAYDTDTVARTHLPHLVGAHTTVVALQNGIDNEERFAAAIGDGHVIGGLALIFSVECTTLDLAFTGR